MIKSLGRPTDVLHTSMPLRTCMESNSSWVNEGVQIPGTIIDTTTDEVPRAQWMWGAKKADGFGYTMWVKDQLALCTPCPAAHEWYSCLKVVFDVRVSIESSRHRQLDPCARIDQNSWNITSHWFDQDVSSDQIPLNGFAKSCATTTGDIHGVSQTLCMPLGFVLHSPSLGKVCATANLGRISSGGKSPSRASL